MATWLEGATEYLSRTLNPQGEGPAPVPPQVIQAPAAPSVQPAPVSMEPTTIYVPGSAPGRGGERAQMELQNVKVTYDPVGGAYEAYQLPKRSEPGFTRIYGTMPVSGGGSGALQSGMVSEKPLTPLIYTQSAKEFAPSARPEFAPMILGAPEKFSRLGAEAYGGYVMPLDDRRVTPGMQVSRYPAESGNLARLADPMGVNRPKSEWSELPWTIDYARSPTFQPVTKQPPPSDRLIGGGKVAAQATTASAMGTVEAGSYYDIGGGRKMWVTTTGALALPTTAKGELSLGMPGGIPEVQNLTGKPLPPAPLTFEGLEKSASQKVYSVLPPAMKPMLQWGSIQIEKMGLTPSDVSTENMIRQPQNIFFKSTIVPAAGITLGEMKGVIERPITTGASFALGAVMGAGFKGLDVVGAKAASGAVEAYPRATSILTKLNTAVLPTALAGVYGIDVVLRSTEGMKAGPGRSSVRFGEILSTETMPLIAGGYVGYKAADIGLKRVPQLYTVPREAEIISGAKPEERAATKATLDIFKNIERVESPMKNAPDFTKVKGVSDLPGFEGKVKATEHSIFGRTTEIGQMPKEWIEPRGMTKDVDIFVRKPSEFGKDIARSYPKELTAKGAEDFTALMSKRTGQTAVDIHPFPEGYPIGRGEEIPTGDYVQALLNPTPKRGGLLEVKGTTQEKLFVQTQKKATSILGEKIGEYGPLKHRYADYVDTLRYTSFLGEQTTGYRKAQLKTSFDALKEFSLRPETITKYKGTEQFVPMIKEMSFGTVPRPTGTPSGAFTGKEDVSFISFPRSKVPASFFPSVFPSRVSISPAPSTISRTPTTLSLRSVSVRPSISSVLSSEPSYARTPPSASIRSPVSISLSSLSSPRSPPSFMPSSAPSRTPSSAPSVSFPSISPPYKPISPIPTKLPGFAWGGGSEAPVRKGKWKSPYRELIPIRSQLFTSGSISQSLKSLTKVKRRKR